MLTLNPLRLIRFYLVIGPMMKLNLYYNMLENGLLFGDLLNTCRSKVMPFHGPTFDEWKEQLERVSGGPQRFILFMALVLLHIWHYLVVRL